MTNDGGQHLRRIGQGGAPAGKKNYAERLSRALALKVAEGLWKDFPGINPGKDGKGQESPAGTAKGFKKLDVNYSTPELGLGLGISIKTVNFPDRKTGRYTKNYTRVDNELRAEAIDYHKRQPFSVLIAGVFLPADACDDAKTATRKIKNPEPSSFGAAVRCFRHRANRSDPANDTDLFERVFIGLYEPSGSHRGEVSFFDVMTPPPKYGRPESGTISLDQLLAETRATYDGRNSPAFEWASGETDRGPVKLEEAGEGE
jgi:hypothetical protein